MLSTSHRFIYLHTPKTAGNAIQTVLLPYGDDRKTVNSTQDGTERFGLKGPVTPRKHATLAEYEKCQTGISKSHRVVLSIRHPLDRIISLYYSPSSWAPGQAPFWDETRFWRFVEQQKTMTDFIRLSDGTLRKPDIVIRYETLNEDFQAALQQLGLAAKPEHRLERRNQSAVSDYEKQRALQDKTLRKALEERFEEDMRVFGYQGMSV